MPSKADLFDFVSSLSNDDFRYLRDAVTYRVNQEKYGLSILYHKWYAVSTGWN